MDDSEKISGNKIFNILEQVKNNHTILNIHIMGTDFDGISIILGVSNGEKPRFFIDYPAGLDSVLLLSAGKKCYFEFSDESKIKYSFRATIDSLFGKRIKFKFPEFIERSQRRKAFRVHVPFNTKLKYKKNDHNFEFDTVDVSEGGILISHEVKKHVKSILFKGSKLYRLILSSKGEDRSVKINIKSAVIVRVEKIDVSRRVNYGLKIIDIDKKEEDELRRFIYYCQRRVLKKRGGLDI